MRRLRRGYVSGKSQGTTQLDGIPTQDLKQVQEAERSLRCSNQGNDTLNNIPQLS